MADRIAVTHAGSLPRPQEVIDLLWAKMDGKDYDEAALDASIAQGVKDIVKHQHDVGVTVVSDGELSKPGFSTYVNQRFTGFEGPAEHGKSVPQKGNLHPLCACGFPLEAGKVALRLTPIVSKLCCKSHGQPVPGVRSAAISSIRRSMSREGFKDGSCSVNVTHPIAECRKAEEPQG